MSSMNRSSKSWSPSKENLLRQQLASLERSTPSPAPSEDKTKFGSSCSINLDTSFIDLPTEPKRRRLMPEDTPSSIGSQENSQVSSRSHSPSLSESLLDDSLMSTPSASPSGTLKEYFRRKYRKDELWASIETNYKYLMDEGIIEACQVCRVKFLKFRILFSLCSRGQKYFNIALVLQDEWLTIFTCPVNTCTCPLKAYAIKNVIWLINSSQSTRPSALWRITRPL